jgi:MFS transporter, Spinster family, sphingosine-1-phosphate transporter
MKTRHQIRQRRLVIILSFSFMLFHQADKLLISPLTQDIMTEFNINKTQMGLVVSGALIVGTIFYPLWGFLFDRFARPKLIALASFIWGSTTWLSAIAPSFPLFAATRASTGIDDSSYPGIYSLIGDHFPPERRGKIYGLLQLSMPLGYLLGMLLSIGLSGTLGWRSVFYITGSFGVVLSLVIFFSVKEVPRGQSEPELINEEEIEIHRFDFKQAVQLLKKKTIWLLFAQGFINVFPWQVITFWFFLYLEEERFYNNSMVLMTMVPAVLMLAGGYFLGGILGDLAFKKTPRGRMLVSAGGAVAGALLIWITLSIPINQPLFFGILMSLTALFMPMGSPNIVSSVNDIALPEVRSSALSIQYFIENSGAAIAPALAGFLATKTSLGFSILIITVVARLVAAAFMTWAAYLIPEDITNLRDQMKLRAKKEISTNPQS